MVLPTETVNISVFSLVLPLPLLTGLLAVVKGLP